MWGPQTTDEYERRLKWYTKKRPRELQAVLDNADTYLKALRAGTKPQHRPFGFMHPEGAGVWAIDQKGAKGRVAQTRLYVFPDANTETFYLITIGDKGSQREDIKTCHNFVAELMGARELRKDEPVKDEKEPL